MNQKSVDTDNAAWELAKRELGSEATFSEIALRAQAIKKNLDESPIIVPESQTGRSI